MDKEQIQKDIEWVERFTENLKRTRDYKDIKQSLLILEKRKKSLQDKLTNNIELD